MLLAATMHTAYAVEVKAASAFYLDGKWEGALNRLSADDAGRPPMKVRLYIQGETAQVFVMDDADAWIEAKAGKFHVAQHNFNAVIFANDSAAGDCWDETWSFAAALDNANQLVTTYSRVVSNVRCLMPKDKSFSSQAAGLLKLQTREAAATTH